LRSSRVPGAAIPVQPINYLLQPPRLNFPPGYSDFGKPLASAGNESENYHNKDDPSAGMIEMYLFVQAMTF